MWNWIVSLWLLGWIGQQDLYRASSGTIHFTSDAPLELIEANSESLKGLIDPAKNTFAFSVQMQTFEGFNSALQQEHFHEKYLETDLYPQASFSGKIIEAIDFTQDGEQAVRAKGILDIHGMKQERIIQSTLTIEGDKLKIHSRFWVPVGDHNIKIPKIVYQKIAEEIQVDVNIQMAKE